MAALVTKTAGDKLTSLDGVSTNVLTLEPRSPIWAAELAVCHLDVPRLPTFNDFKDRGDSIVVYKLSAIAVSESDVDRLLNLIITFMGATPPDFRAISFIWDRDVENGILYIDLAWLTKKSSGATCLDRVKGYQAIKHSFDLYLATIPLDFVVKHKVFFGPGEV